MKVITPKHKVIENYHGFKIADPYRWLEKPDTPETRKWIEQQNTLTSTYLNTFEGKKDIKNRLIEYTNYPKYTALRKEGDYYYYHKNDGLQNQSIFYRSKNLELQEEEVILDPHVFSEDGTAAITNIAFDQDGEKLAYAVSYNGSDWQEIRIKNLNTGEDYPELLQWCKFSGISWSENGDGFYYNRYPDQDGFSFDDSSYHNKVYWHRIGTSQDQDLLIYEEPEQKELSFSPRVCDDNKYLILNVNNGTEPKTNIYYRPLNDNSTFTSLLPERDAYYSFIGNDESLFYLYTNYRAPKGRVIAIDVNNPDQNDWLEIIPEQNDVISFVKIINNHFVVGTMHNAYHQLKIYDLKGDFIKRIDLPKYITITNTSGKRSENELFISYTSFQEPVQIIKYDFSKQELKNVFIQEDVNNQEQYETKQVFYPSKDGTKIPMFLTYKKGLKPSGNIPVLLYGYGGYNISLTPSFSPSQKLWMNSGGIYAVANIRGGGEYGEDWHLAGILEKKQNVFDDFIAAAEWLIDRGYTNNNRIAIMGGSNGGLLVGACITQRPDLFGAAICLVPVTDMLRFHHFTVGRFWTTEFGNAETNPEHFKFMYKYSPLHNVQKHTKYPPTLITTADTDDRVVPLHAKKFAATLQEAQGGDAPILLRVEKNAGHGLGKPTSKVIEEQADIYTFLFKEFEMNI